MDLNSLGIRQDQAMHQLKQPIIRRKSGISPDLKECMAKIKTTDVGNVQHNNRQGKGVTGLLQEGHFSGTANARLQLNFYDQLQQQSQESVEIVETVTEGLGINPESQVQERPSIKGLMNDRFMEIYKELQKETGSDSGRLNSIKTRG